MELYARHLIEFLKSNYIMLFYVLGFQFGATTSKQIIAARALLLPPLLGVFLYIKYRIIRPFLTFISE